MVRERIRVRPLPVVLLLRQLDRSRGVRIAGVSGGRGLDFLAVDLALLFLCFGAHCRQLSLESSVFIDVVQVAKVVRAEFFCGGLAERSCFSPHDSTDFRSSTPSFVEIKMSTTLPPQSTTKPFPFPTNYFFPPFFSLQPNANTRTVQFQRWSSLIQSWCRHHRLYRLSLVEAVESPLFRNNDLKKQLSLGDARTVLDWMCKDEGEGGGGKRAEWVDGHGPGQSGKNVAWIWWRRPEEWAGIIADWVESTGQKNVVLTVYELLEGEATMSQGMPDY